MAWVKGTTIVGIILLAAVPLASALPTGVPAFSVGDSDRIGSYYWGGTDFSYCASTAPVGGFEMPTNSDIRHTRVGVNTSYRVHMEPPVGTTCPTLDFSFETPMIAWPERPVSSFIPFSSDCGGYGQLDVTPMGESVRLNINFFALPAACNAGTTGRLYVSASVNPVHPGAYLVCVPTSLPTGSCVGAWERANPEQGCTDDSPSGFTVVPFILVGMNQCAHPGQGPQTYVGILTYVSLTQDDRGCHVSAGFVGELASCPAEVGAAIAGVPWGHLLP